MIPVLLRRFRAEIRVREDIGPNMTVCLGNDPLRKVNTLVATLLLKEIFHDRITVITAPNGIVCGSREEAASLRIASFTTNEIHSDRILLSSLTGQEIETYLKEKTNKTYTVYIPDTPEVRLLERLARDVPDVRYGA